MMGNNSSEEQKIEKKFNIPNNILSYKDILQHTLFHYLPDETAASFAVISKQFYTMQGYHQAYESMLRKLLQHTFKGKKEKANDIARLNNRLILSKCRFLEWGYQPKWELVSPLECAAFIGDMELVENFLFHLSIEEKHEALQQLKEVKKRNTTYNRQLGRWVKETYAYFLPSLYSSMVAAFTGVPWINGLEIDPIITNHLIKNLNLAKHISKLEIELQNQHPLKAISSKL